MNEFTERYTSYAKAHGKTPADMLAHDKQRGTGSMMNFILWNGKKLREWQAANKVSRMLPENHVAYDAWLSANGSTEEMDQ